MTFEIRVLRIAIKNNKLIGLVSLILGIMCSILFWWSQDKDRVPMIIIGVFLAFGGVITLWKGKERLSKVLAKKMSEYLEGPLPVFNNLDKEEKREKMK